MSRTRGSGAGATSVARSAPRTPRTSDVVAAALQARIDRRELDPDRLPSDAKLMAEYGVSRPTLKRALQGLATSGSRRAGDDAEGSPSTASSAVRSARRRPIRVPKMAEMVAAELRGQIIRGELREGDNLPTEADLIEELGVSRPTLREALRILEAEQLLDIRRGAQGGALVIAPNADLAAGYAGMVLQSSGTTLEDVFRAIAAIEPYAARLIAERPREATLRKLEDILADEKANLHDPARFGEASSRFHKTLVLEANNQTLTLFHSIILSIIETSSLAVSVATVGGGDHAATVRRMRASHRDHAALVEMLRAGDGAEAARHLRDFIEATLKNLTGGPAFAKVIDLFPVPTDRIDQRRG